MKYNAVIKYRNNEGSILEELVPLSALSEKDANFQLQINEELAIKRHGKNLISVSLEEIRPPVGGDPTRSG